MLSISICDGTIGWQALAGHSPVWSVKKRVACAAHAYTPVDGGKQQEHASNPSSARDLRIALGIDEGDSKEKQRTPTGFRRWQITSPKTQKLVHEDDLPARSHKSANDVDEDRLNVEEDVFWLIEITEKISVLQPMKTNEDKARHLFGNALAPALALALAGGLISCSQAGAVPELASIQNGASWLGDLDEIKSGFLSAFLLIFFSEIGDKTFFIAAVLASRKSNAAVFTGTFGALVAMTFISVFLGRTFHYIDGILPFSLGENEFPLDDFAAVILLVYFGISTLYEAASMEGSKAEEEQQEAELAIAGLGANGKGSAIANTALSTFGLVFVAEWGDKSFFSTVALSAASSPIGVVSGAIAGHGIATLLAVLGGSLLSSYISEKVIAYIGGSLFLTFAAFTMYEIIS